MDKDKFENSSDWEPLKRREALLISYDVFVGNCRELTTFLGAVENPRVAIHLRKEKPNTEFDEVTYETTRLLHNFVASALSLLEHMNVYMDKLYGGSDLFAEYESRREEHVVSKPVYRFVYDLRQYVIHNKLPLVGRSTSYHKTRGMRIAYILDVGELKKPGKKNWSTKARQYMDSYGDQLSLGQVAEDYFSVMDEFYRWLRVREPEFNRENPGFLRRRRVMHKYLVIFERVDNNYSACSPDIPGCVASGVDPDEAEENIREAISLHIEGLMHDGLPLPEQVSFAKRVSFVEYVED